MKPRDKNGENDLSGFLRYSEGKMTGKERNAFERNLQKDLFAEEAAEGFSTLSSPEAEDDMARLQQKLRSRVTTRQRFVWYRIAASVAVLMILSTIWLVVRHTEPSENIGELPRGGVTLDISKTGAIHEQKAAEPEAATPSADINRNRENEAKDVTREPAMKTDQATGAVAEVKQERNIPEVALKDENLAPAGKKIAAPPAMARSFAPAERLVRGRIISSEDNQPLPGVTVSVKGTREGTTTDMGGNFSLKLDDAKNQTLMASFIGMDTKEFRPDTMKNMQVTLQPSQMALSEVVVVGYGAKKAGEEQEYEEANSGYSPPAPLNGQRNFDRYVESNLQKPASMAPGQRAVVVLNFIVRTTGIIDSINVIRSPGEEFSDEAIRLIKGGPEWKPAIQDGKVIEDDVRVRIVFK